VVLPDLEDLKTTMMYKLMNIETSVFLRNNNEQGKTIWSNIHF